MRMWRCSSVLWVFIPLFVILLTLTKDCAEAQEIGSPAKDFKRHTIVTPIVHHARTKRELRSTKDEEMGLHHKELTLTVSVEGKKYILELRLNEDLIPHNHVIRYMVNGVPVVKKPSLQELDLCQYSGKIRDKADSWAAISTCHGVRGVIYDGRSTHYIEPGKDESIDSPHFLYNHADMTSQHPCGYRGGVTNNSLFDPELYEQYHQEKSALASRGNRYKRSSEDIQVRGPYNANKQSRYVELLLVADNRVYKVYGNNINTLHRKLKDIANIINSIYSPLNIFIALVGVVVWTEHDEIDVSGNGDDTLSGFLRYRKQMMLEIPNDNAHLLTRQKFNDGVVGKALKGPICTYAMSAGVANDHSEVTAVVAATIAHEMGHNFGMEHDTVEECSCPDDICVMYPYTKAVPRRWSSCSLKSLALAFERGMDYCLRNKPKSLFESPTCGNGFVEAGEQCDCGLDPGSACSACCVPDQCVLRSNATCAAGTCCDLTTCRPKTAGTVCRSADRFCDLPEYCTGHSEFCPEDVYLMDATPCPPSEQAYCVRGSCKSHTAQCRLLWGSTGTMSHQNCYMSNHRGNSSGNCGYDRVQQTFKACADEDNLCGLLHCKHLNEQLQFGMESTAILTHTFIINNSVIQPCRTAMIDLGLSEVDPGLVPDGAVCGHNKMCMRQKCVTVESVRLLTANKPTSDCPSACSGHGVCNSEGHCHCEPGFAPPLCASPGAGGSIDSGPATDPTLQKNFMVAMYIIFLGIIPSILLILLLLYYSRHNVLFWWKRPKKPLQSPTKTSLQQRLSRSASKFAANFNSSQAQANAPPINVHTLSSPDDMSSSLLRSDSDRSPNGNLNPTVNFFGNFHGFTLAPIDKTAKEETPSNQKDQNKSAKITPVHRSASNSGTLPRTNAKPVRTAPPLPVVPNNIQISPKTSPAVNRNNSTIQNKMKAFMATERTEELKAVSNQRPVISNPVLEASTCTAKELISPLQGSKTLGPIRPAPTIPSMSPDLPKRPLSMHSPTNVLQKPLPEEPKKVKEGISLNRIASFLKNEKPRNPVERSHSLPKNPNHTLKIPKNMDKVALRNLQISNPILQKDIELPVNTVPVVSDSEDTEEPNSFVHRTQSMRGPNVTQKPHIQSFGSMRQPHGVVRPNSVVGRPTAPPPPLPNHSKSDLTSIYQSPKPLDRHDYVDCIEEKQAPLAHIDEESDNIYAIIEESPEKNSKPLPGVSMPIKTIPQAVPEGYNTPRPLNSLNSGSSESMGLLGEIVNEIQNRNMDSIYSTATLLRKKKEREKEETKRDSTYMNTDYKTPESVYSNSGAKSNVSTTSSGYLHPSAVNVPIFMNKEKDNIEKAPPSPTMKINSKIPTFARQITPPGLKTTTTFKNVPSSPKIASKTLTAARPMSANSPDLVSSCSTETKSSKPPDVINNNKISDPPKVVLKPVPSKVSNNFKPPLKPVAATIEKKNLKATPSLKTNPSSVQKPNELESSTKVTPINSNSKPKVDTVKSIADSLNKNKPKVVPKPTGITLARTDTGVKPGTTRLSNKPSNVASLQQKFENRKSTAREQK